MLSATPQNGSDKYIVATPVYEGPLDLLLSLIQSADLDITALSIALVTDQYLEHIRTLTHLSAENVSSFLVIASKLVQIKSEALLPKSDDHDYEDESPAEELAQQLIQYKQYKEIANYLQSRETTGYKSFYRLYPSPTVSTKVDFSEYSLADILEAAKSILNGEQEEEPLNNVVKAPVVTIRSKISRIISTLRISRRSRFQEILGSRRSRLDIVVTFLALLELIKQNFVRVQQESTFSDIDVIKTKDWEDDPEFELEFGE